MDAMDLVDFLQTHVEAGALRRFCEPRVSADEAVDALCTLTRDAASTKLEGAVAALERKGVLHLRDVAEGMWRDLVAAEPAALRGTALDWSALMERLRLVPAGKPSERIATLIDAVVDSVRAAARVRSVDDVSATVCAVAAAAIVQAWETKAAAVEPADAATPVQAVAAVTGGVAVRSAVGAARDTLAALAEELTARFDAGAELTADDLVRLLPRLQTKSVTGALTFAYHAYVGDWEDVFLAPPPRTVLGMPAMLREARPWRASDGANPAASLPKAEGGALPPPTQFVYTVGRGREGHVGLAGCVLLPGGGLLAVLPGWHGVRASSLSGGGGAGEGLHYAHYWRVDPAKRVASILEVAETPRGDVRARVKLSFEVDVKEKEEEDDGEGEGEGEGNPSIDWIDAQRDFEGNLVLAWGGYNPLTGGVAWTFYKGLREADAYGPADDPFLDLPDADVHDMFDARLEDCDRVDFRDHGNLMTAEVTHVEETTARGRFLSPVTTVVYSQTTVNVLPGVEATAVWGTAAAYVVWSKDGRAAIVRGARLAGDLTDSSSMHDATTSAAVPAAGMEADVVSIAPWWWPLH